MDTKPSQTKRTVSSKLEELFQDVFQDTTSFKIIFSNKRRKSLEPKKVLIRPLLVGGKLRYQVESTFDNKVTHKNLSAKEVMDFAMKTVERDFKQVNLFTSREEIQVLASKPENPRILRKEIVQTNLTSPISMEHDRKKNYIIPDKIPCEFLIKLGVMDKAGKVFKNSYRKFRQLNRYLEIVEDVFPYLPKDKTLRIIDFGCGKAYLTFALYYYLKILKERDVEIIGLDLKEDVIDFCNQVAKDLGYDQLQFQKGDIANYESDYADMVVTLHACDTATDYALINAVNWNTKVILSVPCCQHQLFKQIKNAIHQPMLKHGILKDRLTEYLTDGLRGLKLEEKGYTVSMIEFTSLEHTARNIMIKAVKQSCPNPYKMQIAKKEYEALRDFYQVNPTIDQL